MEGLKFEYEGTTYNVPCMPNKYWREKLLYYGDCPARMVVCQDSMCYCCIYHRGNQKARKAFYYECFPEERAQEILEEVAASAPDPKPSKKRQKLTQEVFEREDCPEWAEWAAVEADGKAFWFSKKPEVFDIEDSEADGFWYCPVTRRERIDGSFDASTWKESSIKRSRYPEYTFLTDAFPKDLVERVNNLIKKGWYPLGGVVKNGTIYMQTLMKKKED